MRHNKCTHKTDQGKSAWRLVDQWDDTAGDEWGEYECAQCHRHERRVYKPAAGGRNRLAIGYVVW